MIAVRGVISFTVGRTQNALCKGAKIVTPKVLDEFTYSRFIFGSTKSTEQRNILKVED